MPDIYRSIGDPADSTTTRIQGIDAIGALFGPYAGDGMYRERKFRDILDGLSNTIFAVEAGADKAVIWTKPDDLQLDWNNPVASLGNVSDSINLLMADGNLLSVGSDVDDDTFAELASIASFQGFPPRPPITETVNAGSLRRRFDDLNPAATEISISNHQKQIGLAFHNFHSAFKQLPVLDRPEYFDADGNPKLSWRVFLLPFLGQPALYEQFNLDEPWDSPNNIALLKHMPDVYRSLGESWDSSATRMQSVHATPDVLEFSSGTFFGARRSIDPGPYEGKRFRDGLDGLANIFLFSEVGSDKAVPWTKPADVPFDPYDPWGPFGDIGEEMLVTMADGANVFVQPEMEPREFGKLLLVADRGTYPFDLSLPVVDLAIQEGAELGRVEVRKRSDEEGTVDVVVGDPDLLTVHPNVLTFNAEEEIPVAVTFQTVDNGFRDGPRTTTITIGERVYNVTVHDSAASASQDPAPRFIDDGDLGFALTGNWTNVANYGYGADAKVIGRNVAGAATWTFTGLRPGQYDIAATWLNGSDRASHVSYVIRDGAAGAILATATVDQRARPVGQVIDSRPFEDFGSVTIAGDTLVVELSNDGRQRRRDCRCRSHSRIGVATG